VSRYYNPENIDNVHSTRACASPDTTLTAFAQLAALRLNVKRCLISLFDSTQQYIIAEATQTISLQSDQVYDPGDDLWLGTTVLPKDFGLCHLAAALPVKGKACNDEKEDGAGTIIIPDLAVEERFKTHPYVVGRPRARFFAGVPIRSPKGHHIGTYCVIDDKPRAEGLTPAAIEFMKDMAMTVMSYMELARTREEHRRGERMVRGLGSFHEGKSTLRNWRPVVGASDGTDGRLYEPSRLARGGEGQLNAQQQEAQQAEDLIQESEDPATRLTEGIGHSYNTAAPTSASVHHRIIPDGPVTPPLTGTRSSAALSFELIAQAGKSQSGQSVAGTQSSAKLDDQEIERLTLREDMLSLGVKAVFDRASNIIRESIEVEGSIFIDAAIGSFGGLINGGDGGFETSDTSLSSAHTSSGESSGSAKSKSSKSGSQQAITKMCGVLGFSTSSESSINNSIVSKAHGLVPEKLLKGLVKRYPRGKIFHFTEDGHASSGSSSEATHSDSGLLGGLDDAKSLSKSGARRKADRKFSRRTDAEELIKIFPGARSIAVTGLWDSHRSRWFSLGVVWTNNPKRILTVEGDLSYLSSFGNSIMVEVARLDALSSEKAKSDLLGSISHEVSFNRPLTKGYLTFE
jgi:hypothetical protein